MAHYRSVGDVPPKRHTRGGLYYEELMGEEGFSGDSSLLYHRGIPSALSDARPWTPPGGPTRPNLPLLPRHLRPHELFGSDDWREADAVTGRRVLLVNADVRICYAVAGSPSPLFRDAVGDECCYVESGSGTLETVFGALPFRQGDYVIVPRGTAHRWVPEGGQPVRLYCVESSGHIAPARRYLTQSGQFLEDAPYCERDLRAPTSPLLIEEPGPVELLVKHRSPHGLDGTSYLLPHHPFDVVAWDGCLYPYTLNIADFEPSTGRVDRPPPTHLVFESTGFIIGNSTPRKPDSHPQPTPMPYYHSNVDSDEVTFYYGDHPAPHPSGITQGSLSLHPSGHTHAPHPTPHEHSTNTPQTITINTSHPLSLGEAAFPCQAPAYPWTHLP
ncbi:homogentisate 1,2-dioxygenase [Actinocorallia sp. A-T 12471]|uniref:homogentisate 1,2-dioxygenase n=1 Tax=Actinocorallia sp. A-T 12471 TaxID=3089813 RepID=UPI0029CFDD5E|nr:cupin domain-containing protein [Actinocorallia sp. A-T 12471]MDX6738777.1 cupin domain-containing protein [Actinocorallia sp. A-T 12471]